MNTETGGSTYVYKISIAYTRLNSSYIYLSAGHSALSRKKNVPVCWLLAALACLYAHMKYR